MISLLLLDLQFAILFHNAHQHYLMRDIHFSLNARIVGIAALIFFAF